MARHSAAYRARVPNRRSASRRASSGDEAAPDQRLGLVLQVGLELRGHVFRGLRLPATQAKQSAKSRHGRSYRSAVRSTLPTALTYRSQRDTSALSWARPLVVSW